MTAGTILLVSMAVLGALVIILIGLVAFRMFADSSVTLLPVAYRAADGEPGAGEPRAGRWYRGTLRFQDDRLALRGRGGLSVGPWLRGNLDLGMAAVIDEQDAEEIGRSGLVRVPVTYGTASFELALDERHYTALRAWVEAVPPGWNSQQVA